VDQVVHRTQMWYQKQEGWWWW